MDKKAAGANVMVEVVFVVVINEVIFLVVVSLVFVCVVILSVVVLGDQDDDGVAERSKNQGGLGLTVVSGDDTWMEGGG